MTGDRDQNRRLRLLVGSAVASLVVFGVMAGAAMVIPDDKGEGRSEALARVQFRPEQDRPEVAAAGVDGLIQTFEVFGGKNPFERPLSFTPPPTTTTTTTQGGNGGTSSTTTSTTIDDDPSRTHTVELKEIYDSADGTVANVQVDGQLYVGVGEGQVFASSFMVVSLSLADQCGEFLYGDSDFDLCVGSAIRK